VSALDSYQFKAEIATVLEEAVLINWTAAFTFVYPTHLIGYTLRENWSKMRYLCLDMYMYAA